MTYQQSLDYLASLNTFGMRLGLSRICRLAELLGNPQDAYKTVHITGTNGKRSGDLGVGASDRSFHVAASCIL